MEKKGKLIHLDESFTYLVLSNNLQNIFYASSSTNNVIPSYQDSQNCKNNFILFLFFFNNFFYIFFFKLDPVDKISDIQFGSNCPLFKKPNKKVEVDSQNCFSFNVTKVGNQVENFTFYALGRNDMVNWVDGLHSLQKTPMVMIETTSDELKILVDAEMLIRSLDLAEIEISDTPPPVPPPPNDYNFNFII